MKTKKILIAMFAMVCVMALGLTVTACGGDDAETNVQYQMGFDETSYSATTVLGETAQTDILQEMKTIENAFQTNIGVSSNSFTYSAGEDKLRAACDQAKAQLANQAFTGKYIFSVKRSSSKGTSTFYTWSNK